ncbi:MAG: 2-phosphosulfolactate phosphatase [Actinobacteria bacterium]|nr:2-phosphosulfolactate phosphatase [Actinomycetota bacterium]
MPLRVHVVLTNEFNPEEVKEINVEKSVCAVIDTIRASSTIAAMLGCGGKSVFIASDREDAFKLKKIFPDFILCGEINGLPPDGFDYGNSPLDISKIGKMTGNFILMTTNGTKSILKVKDSAAVFILSILNLYSAVDSMIATALRLSCDILFLCSGEKGKIAYDDAYTAGLAVKYLLSRPYSFDFSDTAKLVLGAALSEHDINDALEKSCSARSLRSVGLGDDIAFLSHLNKYNVSPVLVIYAPGRLKSEFYHIKKIPELKSPEPFYLIRNE